MAKIAKRYFEGTAKDGSAATYHYEVAEDEQGNLVCLACGAPCEYHPTDMGIEGIWVAVGPCPKCGLNTQYADEGLWDACAAYDNYKGECLICGDGIRWSATYIDFDGDFDVVTGGFHCASCGAACEVGKCLPRGEKELEETLRQRTQWAIDTRGLPVATITLPDKTWLTFTMDFGFKGACIVEKGIYCGTDAARTAALANAELAKHGLPLIGVDADD